MPRNAIRQAVLLVDFERAQIEKLEIQRLYEQAMLNKQAAGRQLSNLWEKSSSSIESLLSLGQSKSPNCATVLLKGG